MGKALPGLEEGREGQGRAPGTRPSALREWVTTGEAQGRAASEPGAAFPQTGFPAKPGEAARLSGVAQHPAAARGRKSSSGRGAARARRRLSRVLKGLRGQRAGRLPRALSLRAARSALPDSCPVLLRPHRSLFPAPLPPRALHPAAPTRPAPGPRAPPRSRLCRAASPLSLLRAPLPPGCRRRPPYLLLSVTGAVPPLPVGFLLLLLLLEGLRLNVFDFLQLFGRLSHGRPRCPARSPPPGPLTLGDPGGDTLPGRKKGVCAPAEWGVAFPAAGRRLPGRRGTRPRDARRARRPPDGASRRGRSSSPAPGTGSGLGPAAACPLPFPPPSLPPSPSLSCGGCGEAARTAASGERRGGGGLQQLTQGGAGAAGGRGARPARRGSAPALGASAGALRAPGCGRAGRPGSATAGPPPPPPPPDARAPAPSGRGNKAAALPGAAGAPRRALLRAASLCRGPGGRCGGRRAPRRGHPVDRHAWRRRRKRPHRGARRPRRGRRPRGPGRSPPSPPCRPPRAPAEGRGGQDPREAPVPPAALLELDLPRQTMGAFHLHIFSVQIENASEVKRVFLRSSFVGSGAGLSAGHRPPPIPGLSHPRWATPPAPVCSGKGPHPWPCGSPDTEPGCGRGRGLALIRPRPRVAEAPAREPLSLGPVPLPTHSWPVRGDGAPRSQGAREGLVEDNIQEWVRSSWEAVCFFGPS